MKMGTIADAQHPNRIEILIESEDTELLAKIKRVLKPLEEEMRFHRGYVKIGEPSNNVLQVTGYASDITSLRSVCNGLLKCMYLCVKTFQLFETST